METVRIERLSGSWFNQDDIAWWQEDNTIKESLVLVTVYDDEFMIKNSKLLIKINEQDLNAIALRELILVLMQLNMNIQ